MLPTCNLGISLDFSLWTPCPRPSTKRRRLGGIEKLQKKDRRETMRWGGRRETICRKIECGQKASIDPAVFHWQR